MTDSFGVVPIKKSGKSKEVRQCRTCKHRPDTICFRFRTVMNPDESCSQWEK